MTPHPWYAEVNSEERALFVKDLRCSIGYTWRAVAQECNDKWNGDWNSNQLAGMYMCHAAADWLKEDATKEPWN